MSGVCEWAVVVDDNVVSLCRGLVLEEKPELKRVLEQRRLELTREEEQAQRRPSDLEKELRKRQQKLQEVSHTLRSTT